MNFDPFPFIPDDNPLFHCPDCGKYTRDLLDHYTRRCPRTQPKRDRAA